MNKASKGALAIGTAGVLLLGGAGSLAFWTDSATVSGSSISAGHIELGDQSCGDWLLDGGNVFESTSKLVPGDVLSRVCTFTVDAAGDHLKATFAATAPTFSDSSALTATLTPSATFKLDGVSFGDDPVVVTDGADIEATVTVTFDGSATNASQTLSTTLDDITISATQSH